MAQYLQIWGKLRNAGRKIIVFISVCFSVFVLSYILFQLVLRPDLLVIFSFSCFKIFLFSFSVEQKACVRLGDICCIVF